MIFIFGDARNPALELIQSDSARARQMSALVFICAAHIDHQRIAAIDQLRGLGNAQRPRRRVSIGQTSSAPEIAAAAIKIRFNGSVKNVTNYLFFCGGKSVQTPSNHSAAMPTDSQSVGCGWMVLPISVASAPISIARQISPIKS